MSTAYLLATWSGRRRYRPPGCAEPAFYLERHFHSLQLLPHDLDLVLVLVPHHPNEPPEFTRALRSLPRSIRKTRVEVLRRQNAGLSYGSWIEGMRARPDFDRYVLMEDDYVFSLPHFDRELAEIMNGAGYLCAHCDVLNQRGRPPLRFASVSIGMVDADVARAAARATWSWGTSQGGKYGAGGDLQIGFSLALSAYGLEDASGRFRVGFDGRTVTRPGLRPRRGGPIIWFHPEHERVLLRPVR